MVTKKGRPNLGEEPQKPRFIFAVSVLFENKPIIEQFKKNCRSIDVPICDVFIKKIIDVNKEFANAFISKKSPEVESTEEIAQEDVLESEEGFEKVSELDEEVVEETEEEFEEKDIQEEEEKENVEG